MKAPRESLPKVRLPSIVLRLLYAWIFSLGLSQIILRLMRLPADWLAPALAALALLILLALLTWSRYNLLALLSLLLLCVLFYVPTRGFRLSLLDAEELLTGLRGWLTWANDWIWGYAVGSPAQLSVLALLVSLLTAGLSYLFIARFSIAFPAVLAVVATAVLARDLPAATVYFWLAPPAVVALTVQARNQKKTLRFLKERRLAAQTRLTLQATPVAALALALALLLSPLVPAGMIHSRGLEGFVDDLTSLWSGIRWENTDMPDFSLMQAGYYPLIDRLGGPVLLSDQAVLEVSGTTEALLLRGSVSQVYDGHNWQQDPDRSFYRFDSPLWQTEQHDVFDLNLPSLAPPDPEPALVYRTVRYYWTPLNMATRIIFTAGRPLSIQTVVDQPFQVYFRPSGQLFSKYWLQPHQQILMETRLLQTELSGFARTVRQIQDGLDAGQRQIPAAISQRYLQMPALPEYETGGFMSSLVASLTEGIGDPYQRVLILRQYLRQNCQYNLTVSVPPADMDFVTWFLQTREGYCVYFATALAMMCRLAGIPARYVEGYYAPGASETEEKRVLTGMNAHAWTEVYLAGIGWTAVDATPGAASTQPDPDQTPSPTPKPSPNPSGQAASPSPAVSRPAGPSATPAPAGVDWALTGMRLARWLLLLLLLLLPVLPAVFAIRSYRQLKRNHDRSWLSDRLKDRRIRACFYWIEMKKILSVLGIARRPGETVNFFLFRLQEADSWLAGGDGA